jgi:DNA-binding MarR family transcriptional regulator
MAKPASKKIPLKLADITTYQSGVVQSAAMRKLNRFTADFLAAYKITTMEWFIIGTIYDAGAKGMSLSELKDRLATTMPFITNSINSLIAKGILIKSPHNDDARTKIVTIVPAYRQTCRDIESYLRAKMRELFYKDISPEELRVYVSVLYRISDL